MTKESLSDKEIIKEVFKIYEDEKYRRQFNNATKMMEDLIKETLKFKNKIHNEKVKEAQDRLKEETFEATLLNDTPILDVVTIHQVNKIFLEVFDGDKK